MDEEEILAEAAAEKESAAAAPKPKSDDTDVKITYETLYEMLRREKNRGELQEMPESFIEDVLQYLKEKKEIIEKSKNRLDLFSAAEKDKTFRQIENIKKIILELYGRREKKVIDVALNKARTDSGIIDTGNMLTGEKQMYEKLVELLGYFRRNIVLNLLELKEPFSDEKNVEIPKTPEMEPEQPNVQPQKAQTKPEPAKKAPGSAQTKQEQKSNTEPKKQSKPEQEESSDAKLSAGTKKESKTKLIRFIHPVPKFVGKELETYGPFEEEDISSLPTEIADVLISKGRAEEMSQ